MRVNFFMSYLKNEIKQNTYSTLQTTNNEGRYQISLIRQKYYKTLTKERNFLKNYNH
jgi:hypothetical protein